MLALVLVGCVQTLSMTATQMILNVATPDEYRGRAMSVYMMTWNAAPLSALPAGWIADQVGAPLTVAGSGLLTVIAFLIASVALVGLRRFRDDDYLMGWSAARREQEPGALVRS
jgi:MFS family permease